MSQEENHKAGLYYVIIAPVMEDERLEHSEIVFYALISGLANNKGYCFASDEYLSKRMKCDDRTIRKWLKNLEDFGYIKRETTKNGMTWDRKIYVLFGISNNVYERPPRAASNGPYRAGSYGTPGPDRTEPQGRIVSEEIYIESKERDRPPAPKGEFVCFGSHVKLKKEEYDTLCRTHTKERVDMTSEEMNDYLKAHGKKYKDYAAAIRNWLKRASNGNGSVPAIGTAFKEKIRSKCENNPSIVLYADSIEFLRGASPSLFYKFDENNKMLILERLKIMGITLQ